MTFPGENLLGRRFGRLLVIEKGPPNNGGSALWKCQCDCGKQSMPNASNLKRQGAKSCGCLTVEATIARLLKHGHACEGQKTIEYKRWKGMNQRCRARRGLSFKNYVSKGITVCERWQSSFEAFLEDMGDIPSPNHTLERRDNLKGYGPDNCVWATSTEQANNTSRNRRLVVGGQSMTCAEAVRKFKISESTLRHRLKIGWKPEDAVVPPLRDGEPQPVRAR